MANIQGHHISFDTTTDEWGNTRHGWWCDTHEQGGFAETYDQRDEEARAHVESIPHDDEDEDE